jgi:hypothetical protein
MLSLAAGGDQLVGRVACGLPLDDRMSILPPHFTLRGLEKIETRGWDNLVQGYENYGPKFASVLPLLLAAVVHHQDWLRLHLHKSHPLFSNRLFASGAAKALRKHIIFCSHRCEETGMAATGVLSYLAISHQVTVLKSSVEDLQNKSKRNCEEIIDKIEEISENVPKRTCQEVLNNFEVSGALPITRDQISSMFINFSENMLNEIHTLVAKQNQADVNDNNNESQIDQRNSTTKFKTWHWKGKFHMVPEGFRLPQGPPKQLWDLWWKGNNNDKIQPYRFLCKGDLACSGDVVNLTRIRKVIEKLISISIQQGNIESKGELAKMSYAELDHIFDAAFAALMGKLYPIKELLDKRLGDVQYSTVYEGLRKVK